MHFNLSVLASNMVIFLAFSAKHKALRNHTCDTINIHLFYKPNNAVNRPKYKFNQLYNASTSPATCVEVLKVHREIANNKSFARFFLR